MKKSISALLVLTMCFCLFGLTGCGEKAADVENPYADLDMTEYVTLPDYDKYTTSEPQVEEVSEEEVETEISARLEEALHLVNLGKDRKSTRLNSSHNRESRMPSSA